MLELLAKDRPPAPPRKERGNFALQTSEAAQLENLRLPGLTHPTALQLGLV